MTADQQGTSPTQPEFSGYNATDTMPSCGSALLTHARLAKVREVYPLMESRSRLNPDQDRAPAINLPAGVDLSDG